MISQIQPLDLSFLVTPVNAQPRGRALTREEIAALPPWDQRAPQTEPSRLVRETLSSRALLPADALRQRSRTGEDADNAKLFALHRALNGLSSLAGRAQEDRVPEAERSQLSRRFAAGLSEVDRYLTGLSIEGADLVKGLRLPRLESEPLTRPAYALVGQVLHQGPRSAAVDAFQGVIRFPIEARRTGLAGPRTLDIDFSTLRGPRTMDAAAAHINEALKKAGFQSRIVVNTAAGPPQGFSFTLQAARGEQIGFPGSSLRPPGEEKLVGQLVASHSFEGLAEGVQVAGGWTGDQAGGAVRVRAIPTGGEGKRAIELEGEVSQTVTLQADKTYRLLVDFDAIDVPEGADVGGFEVVWNGDVLRRVEPVLAAPGGAWGALEIELPAGAGPQDLTLRRLPGPDGTAGLLIDDVRVQEITTQTAVGQRLTAAAPIFAAPDETQLATGAGLSEVIQTEAGRRYALSFDFQPGADAPAADQPFEVVWNGAVVGRVTPRTMDSWRAARFEMTGTGGQDTLELRRVGGEPGPGAWVDNVRFSPLQDLPTMPNAPPPPAVDGATRLGLAGAGWISAPRVDRLVERTSLQAGDFFTVTLDDRSPVRIAIDARSTLRDVARLIDRALGRFGDAVVRTDRETGAERISITPRGGRIEIGPGSANRDALEGLGLAPGVAMQLETGRPDPNRRPQISLDFKADLRLDTRDDAKKAKESIDGVMRRVRQAFREANEDPAARADRLRAQARGAGGPAPEFLTSQIANYREALARLTAGG
jgi:hypothetical protein